MSEDGLNDGQITLLLGKLEGFADALTQSNIRIEQKLDTHIQQFNRHDKESHTFREKVAQIEEREKEINRKINKLFEKVRLLETWKEKINSNIAVIALLVSFIGTLVWNILHFGLQLI